MLNINTSFMIIMMFISFIKNHLMNEKFNYITTSNCRYMINNKTIMVAVPYTYMYREKDEIKEESTELRLFFNEFGVRLQANPFMKGSLAWNEYEEFNNKFKTAIEQFCKENNIK